MAFSLPATVITTEQPTLEGPLPSCRPILTARLCEAPCSHCPARPYPGPARPYIRGEFSPPPDHSSSCLPGPQEGSSCWQVTEYSGLRAGWQMARNGLLQKQARHRLAHLPAPGPAPPSLGGAVPRVPVTARAQRVNTQEWRRGQGWAESRSSSARHTQLVRLAAGSPPGLPHLPPPVPGMMAT